MNILLVDDEPRVLAGLERVLCSSAPPEWNVFTAGSGARALEVMAGDAIDVVVSDMRMPGMDGAELLRTIHQRWPAAVRMILSGHADQRASLRVAEVAHQFLDKPCDSARLIATLGRIEAARAMLGGDLLPSLGRIGGLPPAPSIYWELGKLFEDDKAGPDRVAAVVRRDPALVATLLKLVNSGFFCRGTTTTDIVSAVRRLGIGVVRAIALDVMSRPSGGSNATIERRRSIVAPASAREDAFVAGMLHDLGERVLAPDGSAVSQRILTLMVDESQTRSDAERTIVGVGHAEMGGYLLTLWGFSAAVSLAVAQHHRAWTGDDVPMPAVAAIHVAEALLEVRSPDLGCVRALGHPEPPAQWAQGLTQLEAS